MSTASDDSWTFTGFVFPTTTPIPDQVFDELLHLLSGNELKVLLYICRRTFGFKKESDTISLSQMVNGITTRDGRTLDRGTGLSKATVARCLNTLEERNIIRRIRQFSDERGDEPTTYALNMVSPGSPPPLSHFETGISSGMSQNETGGVSVVRQGVSQPRDTPVSHQRDTQQTVLQQTVLQQTVLQQTEQQQARHASRNGNDHSVPRTSDVVVALVGLGISQTVAKRLARQYEENRVREKIDYLAYLQEADPDKVTNARGWLRCAIEEDYGPPDGYRSSEERAAAAAQEKARQEQLDALLEEETQRLQQEDATQMQRRQALRDQYGTTEREDRLWKQFREHLQMRSAQGIVAMIRDAQLLRVREDEVLIGVPNEATCSLLCEHPGTNRIVSEAWKEILDTRANVRIIALPQQLK